MIAFPLVLIIIFLTLPLQIFTHVVHQATTNRIVISNLKKNIIVFAIPGIYISLFGRNIFIEESVRELAILSSLFDGSGAVIFIYGCVIYLSIQFFRIAFGDGGYDFRISRTLLFGVAFCIVFLFSLQFLNHSIFGFKTINVIFSLYGFMFFVFLAGLHAVFAKYVLFFDVLGFILYFSNTHVVNYEAYFLILDIIPEFPGVPGLVIAGLSMVISGYNFGVERKAFPPLFSV